MGAGLIMLRAAYRYLQAVERPAAIPLAFEGASLVYRGGEVPVAALTGVDFALAEGELAAVMGASGSGKSSLLNLAAGLLAATSGRVVAFGRDLGAMDDDGRALHMRERVGYVFQFFNLLPALSVAENVALPLEIAGRETDPAWIDELLATVRLLERRDHRPGELSGGEMQRVSIARALATRPKLILADEPTGNVAARDGVAILDLIVETRERYGAAVLLVTHNPRDAARADRLVFLDEGRLVAGAELRGDFGERDVHEALAELGI